MTRSLPGALSRSKAGIIAVDARGKEGSFKEGTDDEDEEEGGAVRLNDGTAVCGER